MEPYMYKRNAEAIIYHIQTKLHTQLSDDLKHDIYANVQQAVLEEAKRAREQELFWYDEYCKLKALGFPLNWNELRIRIAREKDPIPPDILLKWMFLRENGYTIRGVIPSDNSILREMLEPSILNK